MQTQRSNTSSPIHRWHPYQVLFNFTLKQMLWSRRTIFVLLVSLSPVALSIVFRLAPHRARDILAFIPMITMLVFLMFVTILIALFYGTGIIADEIDGKTLTYLVMRPLRRFSILLSKFAAYFVGTVVLITPAHLLATLIIATDPQNRESLLFNLGMSLRYVGVISLGLLAYGAVFTVLGVRFKHSVLWGLLVAFGWEKITLVVPGNIKKFSVIHYLLSIYPRHGLPTRPIQNFLGDSPASPWLAIVMIFLITALFLSLSIWIFQRREYRFEA